MTANASVLARHVQFVESCSETDVLVYLVPSQSVAGNVYRARIATQGESMIYHSCSCPAASFRPKTPCAHAFAAFNWWRYSVVLPGQIEGYLKESGAYSKENYDEEIRRLRRGYVRIIRSERGQYFAWAEGEARPVAVVARGEKLEIEGPHLFAEGLYIDAVNLADKLKMMARYELFGQGMATAWKRELQSQVNQFRETYNYDILDLGCGVFGPVATAKASEQGVIR